METAYTFSDVMFVPKYSDIQSRSEVNLTTKLGKLTLQLPVVSANMADVTEKSMVLSMHSFGGLGILHRFMSIEDNVIMFKETLGKLTEHDQSGDTSVLYPIAHEYANRYVGVSVGVGEEGRERFKALYDAGARTFCIDVAHGHHVNVRDMINWIIVSYHERADMTIIAGNVASVEGALDLFSWGADVVKIGVGPGSACQTRENTGVGVPQLYILEKTRKHMPKNTYIIADGGIKKTGDIAKALKYADAVMVGGLLAGTIETPGHVYETMDGQFYKTMAGSASAESKVKGGKEKTFIEGGIRQVPFRGHVKYILNKVRENVQSSFSYSGARDILEFRNKSELIKISGGGKQESKL